MGQCHGLEEVMSFTRPAEQRRENDEPKALHDWRRGVVVSGVRRMNEVNARRARLYHLGM